MAPSPWTPTALCHPLVPPAGQGSCPRCATAPRDLSISSRPGMLCAAHPHGPSLLPAAPWVAEGLPRRQAAHHAGDLAGVPARGPALRGREEELLPVPGPKLGVTWHPGAPLGNSGRSLGCSPESPPPWGSHLVSVVRPSPAGVPARAAHPARTAPCRRPGAPGSRGRGSHGQGKALPRRRRGRCGHPAAGAELGRGHTHITAPSSQGPPAVESRAPPGPESGERRS